MINNGSEVIIVGSGDGYLYAFEGLNGSVKWKAKLDDPVGLLTGGIGSSPFIDSDSGIVYSGGMGLSAVNADTGEIIWGPYNDKV